MTRKQAEETLYGMWEDGLVPSNFTEEHSEYEQAIQDLIKNGFIVYEDFF
jgi:hypothetical protein